jgi:arabinan endo-1,5-alpha-L-arabinosidase
VNIFGAYGQWGDQLKSDGERSQGHNSIIAAEDGRTYLVYHSRFQNGGEGHQVRVHQVFQNEDGWLVAAPFEYTGETATSADIATTQQVALPLIAGTYQLLIHKYGLKHEDKELVKPEEILLHADGIVSGSKNGSWKITDGTSYVSLTLGGIQYKGVMVEQTMEPSQTKRVVSFTALAKNGVTIWGYRSGDDPTGIEKVAIESQQTKKETIFDLQGRHVNTPAKGIYIINGKKTIK